MVVNIYKIDYEKVKRNILALNKRDYLVLKSNAYGFGLEKVLKLATSQGMYKFALIDIEDCVFIKKKYPNTTVLLLGTVKRKELWICEKYHIDVTITNIDELAFLRKYKINIQIEINSGMNRFGIRIGDFEKVLKLIENSSLRLTGIYSHNATNDLIHQKSQIQYFYNVVKDITDIDVHFQSSSLKALSLNFTNSKRIGAALYDDSLRVYANIININYCFKGEYIGYDYSYRFIKDSYVGVINLGYADGLERNCEGFKVYIKDKYYPLIGKACMNHCFVLLDTKKLSNEEVVFIGEDNKIDNYLSFFKKIPHEVYLSYLKNG